MLTDAYGVGGWVGLKNINAYGLRWIWVVGRKIPNAYGYFYDGGAWCVDLTLTKDKNNFYTL